MAQALRRSLAVLGALAVLAVSAVWWLSRPEARSKEEREAAMQASLQAAVPSVKFVDITRSAGVTFRHYSGAQGEKFLPETMGGGVAFFDFDQDGDADLLLVNSGPWPGAKSGETNRVTSALYENDGGGHFRDVTQGSGLDVMFYGMGVACGDFDNDGKVDVLLTGVGGNRLFRNRGGGKFEDVTGEAGVGGEAADWSTAAAWFDFDNDGDLDLFVGRYVHWSRELDLQVNNQMVGGGRAYGRPWNFPGSFPRLFRNDTTNGRTHFTDISTASGVEVKNPATGAPVAKSLAVAPIDLNQDGWMDLIVANDTVQNFVFTNRHDGTFREIGAAAGVAFDAYGQARGAMGIDAARFRNDDALGIAIGNFANEMNALYVSQMGAGRELLHFADEAVAAGIGPASRALLKFGLFFFDYDLDGRLDILTANGHLDEDVEKMQAEAQYRQPAQLFWNSGGRQTFVEVGADRCGLDLFQPLVGRGSAYADIDGDGDLDVVLTQIDGPPLLLRNEQATGNAWIRLVLRGKTSNRDAIGAWIRVRSGGRTLERQVMPTKSYLSQSELPVTIGLGSGGKIDSVEVLWPGKTWQPVNGVRLGAVTEVIQASRVN